MKTLTELQTERDGLLNQAAQLLDVTEKDCRAMSPDEQDAYDRTMRNAEEINLRIDRTTKFEEVSKPRFKPRPGSEIDPNNDVEMFKEIKPKHEQQIQPSRFRGNLKGFANSVKGEEEAYDSGMWLRAVVYRDAKAIDFCRQKGIGTRMALSEGINTAGGALVPTEFENAVIKLVETYGLVRQKARMVQMGSDTRIIPRRVGGMTGVDQTSTNRSPEGARVMVWLALSGVSSRTSPRSRFTL